MACVGSVRLFGCQLIGFSNTLGVRPNAMPRRKGVLVMVEYRPEKVMCVILSFHKCITQMKVTCAKTVSYLFQVRS